VQQGHQKERQQSSTIPKPEVQTYVGMAYLFLTNARVTVKMYRIKIRYINRWKRKNVSNSDAKPSIPSLGTVVTSPEGRVSVL
jgi:hypothetical protein